MSLQFSRRDFLIGVVASSAASAVTIYLLPGGRSTGRAELRLVTGVDPTGARGLLLNMWNDANPDTPVTAEVVAGSTGDQRREMINAIEASDADVVNIDVIDIPDFADRGLITPTKLDNQHSFLDSARLPSQVAGESELYWAAPFNTDVGMLFERLPAAGDLGSGLSLAEVIDVSAEPDPGGPDDADPAVIVGQLNPLGSVSQEAFVVNVLEHALSRNPEILDASGNPSTDIAAWEEALAPLREAILAGRIVREGTEEESRIKFTDNRLRYLRNWPVQYRELQRRRDPDAIASRIMVRGLPTGILGGQSLAVVSGSRHRERAGELIRFLTSDEAQRVLAAHGLAPARSAAYNDSDLRAFIPHLASIRRAVENARPRPIHPRYRELSEAVRDHMAAFLGTPDSPPTGDERLSSGFIDDMRVVLD